MENRIVDTAICLYCEKEIRITDASQYGYKKKCPHCSKKLDIFPASDSYIETPWGTFGVKWESKRLELVKSFIKGLF